MISFNIQDFWASTAYMGDGHDVTNLTSTFFTRYGGVVPAVLWTKRNLMWIKVDSNTYHGDDFFDLALHEFTNTGLKGKVKMFENV